MSSVKRSARPSVNIMVTVDASHRDRLEEMAGRLAAAGMQVADTFLLGGVIVGKVAQTNLPKLHAVEGIEAIEEEPTFEVGA